MPSKSQRAKARAKREQLANQPAEQAVPAQSNAEIAEELALQEEVAPKAVIPDAPLLNQVARDKMADPLMTKKAGRALDWAEGRGDSGFEAHSRGMHSELEDHELDARGKSTATSYLTEYDQNKAYSSVMATSAGRDTDAQARGPRRYANGFANVPTWDQNADKVGGKNARGYRTAPLARIAESNGDGTYEHFNAKVMESFVKHSKDGTGARVQTLYPSSYERLEAPSNPAVMPEAVQLDSITDTDQLRHVEPTVKDQSATGRVLSNEEVAQRKEAAAKKEAQQKAAAAKKAQQAQAPKPQPKAPVNAPKATAPKPQQQRRKGRGKK